MFVANLIPEEWERDQFLTSLQLICHFYDETLATDQIY